MKILQTETSFVKKLYSLGPALKYWVLSFLFTLPFALPYIKHFLLKPERLLPTGFIIYDMAYYMANAREHFDFGSFQLTYGNPFSPFYETPAIYFQPMTLLLGIVWKISNWNPGYIFIGFGVVSGIICSRIAISLFKEIVGFNSWAHRLCLILFFYGGGTLVLAGILYSNGLGLEFDSIVRFDPQKGLWFLNFGRNLVFPTEALYHALFLGGILCLIKKKYQYGLLLGFVLSMSHPFTGIEYILIILSWSFFEIFFLKNKSIPKYLLPACILILFYHLAFYLGYLNLFPEHKQLMLQWSLPWVLKAENIILAYCLVGLLALWRIRDKDHFEIFSSDINNRLFFIWFLVAFFLANHEFLFDPVQPLHFTRGYIWIPLFLMGVKTLLDLFAYLREHLNKYIFILVILIIMGIFVADNGMWLGSRFINSRQHPLGLYISPSQKEVLDWISDNNIKKSTVVCQDNLLSFYITCYTSLRTWHSHKFNTPYAELRKSELIAFFNKGVFLENWETMDMLLIYYRKTGENVLKNNPSWFHKRNSKISFQNSEFLVFQLSPVKEDRN